MNEILKDGRELWLIERFFNAQIVFFKYNLPKLYSFLKCSNFEFVFERKILAFLTGTLYGIIIFILSINQLEGLSESIKKCMVIIIISIISIGMALIPNSRCVMTLSTFNFITSSFKIMITSLIFMSLLKGPLDNTFKNLNELTKSVSCQVRLFRNLSNLETSRYEMHKNLTNEIKQVNNQLFLSQQRVNKLGDDLILDLTPSYKNKRSRYSEFEEYDFLISDNSTVLGQMNNSISLEEGIFEDNMHNCEKMSNGIRENCEKRKSDSIKFDFDCGNSIIRGCNEEIRKSDYSGVNSNIDNLKKSKEIFDFEIEFEEKELSLNEKALKSKAKIVSINVLIDELNGELKYIHGYVSLFMRTLSILANFSLAFVFLNSYKYNRNYLNDIQFDNCTITQYFRHLDARRYKLGKRTLLPLKRFEQENLYYSFQMKVSAYQKFNIKKNIFLNKCLTAFTVVLFLIDYILYDFVYIIRLTSNFDNNEQTNSLGVRLNVEGDGAISNLIRKYFNKIENQYKLENSRDINACLPNLNEIDLNKYFKLIAFDFLLIMFNFSEIYLKRLNRFICSYFNRKREKQRIIWLYNTTMKRRLNFITNAKQKVMLRKANNQLEFDSYFTRFLIENLKKCNILFKLIRLLFGIGKKYCVLCDHQERENSLKCEKCAIIYCKECWIDLNQNCVGCCSSYKVNQSNNEHLNYSNQETLSESISNYSCDSNI